MERAGRCRLHLTFFLHTNTHPKDLMKMSIFEEFHLIRERNFEQLIFNNKFPQKGTSPSTWNSGKANKKFLRCCLNSRQETLHEQIICSVLYNICSNRRNFLGDRKKWNYLFAEEISLSFFLCHRFLLSSHPSRTSTSKKFFKRIKILYNGSMDKMTTIFSCLSSDDDVSSKHREQRGKASELRWVPGKMSHHEGIYKWTVN